MDSVYSWGWITLFARWPMGDGVTTESYSSFALDRLIIRLDADARFVIGKKDADAFQSV